jgi:ABC-type nitrate/sulfonate/bicarbonate transport system ATPase subunit
MLLLDGPFVSLDRAKVRDLRTLVAGLIVRSQGTAVQVSHDPQAAAFRANRIVLIVGRPVRIVAALTLDTAPAQCSRSDTATYEDRIETAMLDAMP